MLKLDEAKKLLLQTMRLRFWTYCRVMAPDFYTPDRAFLKDLATKLQWFMEEAEESICVINMPPRHGKSRTATLFSQWLFGTRGKNIKIMTGSYNETLSETFAKAVRDQIAAEPADNTIIFRDVFRM